NEMAPFGIGNLGGWYNRTLSQGRLETVLDSTISMNRMLLGTYPDNVRMRGQLALLLALRKQPSQRDAEVAGIAAADRRGVTVTGTDIADIPFGAAAAGDLAGAKRVAHELPVTDRTWAGWWTEAGMVERGATYAGGQVPEFLHSPEYQAIRRQLD